VNMPRRDAVATPKASAPSVKKSLALAVFGMTTLIATGCNPAIVSASQNPSQLVPNATASPAPVAVSTPSPESSPPAGCSAMPPELAGTWTVTIVPADLTPEVFDNKTGDVVLTLGPGTSMRTIVGGSFINAPWACVVGDRLLMSEERVEGPCVGLGQPSYTWRIEANQLVLTNLDDQCVARAFTNTVHPWDRK
jgi:hypothetical protein